MRPIVFTLTEERILKALFAFMAIIAALLIVSADADAAARRQVVRQKTIVRGKAARGIGRTNIQQTTVINGGAVAQASYGNVQRSFVRQRSFASYGYAPVQAQVFAAPVVYQAPVLQQAVVQQVQVQAAPVVYQAPVQQLTVQAAPVVQLAPVQFDVTAGCAGCVAPSAGIVRQRTFMRAY